MTSSILTNPGAMTALRSLQATNSKLATTQDRISTGLKVNGAKDNAAAWSVAQAMKTKSAGFKTLSEQTTVGLAAVGLGLDAAKNLVELYEKIHQKALQLVSSTANNDTTNADIFTAEIKALEDAAGEIINRAEFNGVNFLTSTGSNSYTVLTGVADGATYSISGSTALDLGSDISTVAAAESALSSIRTLAADLGAAYQRLEAQKSFFNSMEDALTKGVGALVEADMTEESARLQALQVQQQLGAQALSIANQAPQVLLSLFR
ncbi:MAG: flagellin [Rhodospirillaceae bacterium]